MYEPTGDDLIHEHEHRLAEAEGEQAVYLVCTLCPYFEVKDDTSRLSQAQDH